MLEKMFLLQRQTELKQKQDVSAVLFYYKVNLKFNLHLQIL